MTKGDVMLNHTSLPIGQENLITAWTPAISGMTSRWVKAADGPAPDAPQFYSYSADPSQPYYPVPHATGGAPAGAQMYRPVNGHVYPAGPSSSRHMNAQQTYYPTNNDYASYGQSSSTAVAGPSQVHPPRPSSSASYSNQGGETTRAPPSDINPMLVGSHAQRQSASVPVIQPVPKSRKRRGPAQDSPSASVSGKSSKRGKEAADSAGPPNKRARLNAAHSHSSGEGIPEQTNLVYPTPPLSNQELAASESIPQAGAGQGASQHERLSASTIPERTLGITEHPGQGRQLAHFVGGQIPAQEVKSARTVAIPRLGEDSAGRVTVSTSEVLETEVEWLASQTREPPSPVATVVPRTPQTDEVVLFGPESPESKRRKMAKRMDAFTQPPRIEANSMTTTHFSEFGRLAVGKDLAVKFMGLVDQPTEVKEWTVDQYGQERPLRVLPSTPVVKPQWPDEEAPWQHRNHTLLRDAYDANEKAAILRRYLESEDASDEDSEDQVPQWQRSAQAAASRSSRSYADQIRHTSHAEVALREAVKKLTVSQFDTSKIACKCGIQNAFDQLMAVCSRCSQWHHLGCNGLSDLPLGKWYCETCAPAARLADAAQGSTGYRLLEERMSAFKGESNMVALAPSPSFAGFARATSIRGTPVARAVASTGGDSARSDRAQVLTYGAAEHDMWAFVEDDIAPARAPSTPIGHAMDRFSTPRLDELPFDVNSTPSRNVDLNFGHPSFSLFPSFTPLGGARGRVPSMTNNSHMAGNNLFDTPTQPRGRNTSFGQPLTDMIPTRTDFFRDLNRAALPMSEGGVPASPTARWGLMGAHPVSPSPFAGGHRRSASGNKLSSLRSSSRAIHGDSGFGLGVGLPLEEEAEEEDASK